MNTRNLLIICTTLILIGILFWPTLYRYDKTILNGNTIPIKINRLTGNTEYYLLGKWNNPADEKKPEKTDTLPFEEQTKLNGSAKIGFGALDGNIYNGSNWTVKELTVQIIGKEKNGSIRWDRNYKTYVDISPLSVGRMYVSIDNDNNLGSFEWNIIESKGYKGP